MFFSLSNVRSVVRKSNPAVSGLAWAPFIVWSVVSCLLISIQTMTGQRLTLEEVMVVFTSIPAVALAIPGLGWLAGMKNRRALKVVIGYLPDYHSDVSQAVSGLIVVQLKDLAGQVKRLQQGGGGGYNRAQEIKRLQIKPLFNAAKALNLLPESMKDGYDKLFE